MPNLGYDTSESRSLPVVNPIRQPTLRSRRALRWLLTVDGALLFFLGAFLIVVPKRLEAVFHFQGLPDQADYLTGMWGSVLVAISLGYLMAAAGNPQRHILWVQVGIARGLLEAMVGVVCLARGVVPLGQAWLGLILAGAVTVGYLVLYPRPGPPMKLLFNDKFAPRAPPSPPKL